MADTSLVKEKMHWLGEILYRAGYDGPQEVIEGHNPIGSAVSDCRSPDKAKLVAEYLKDLHQTFKTRNPDPEGNRELAVKACQSAWATVRAALSDDPDVAKNAANATPVAPPPPTTPLHSMAKRAAQANFGPGASARRPANGASKPAPSRAVAAQRLPAVSFGKGMPTFRPGVSAKAR